MSTRAFPNDTATAKRIERLPALGEFVARTEDHLSKKGPSGIWDCLTELQALTRAELVRDLFRTELEQVAEDPCYIPNGSFDTLILAQREHFLLIAKLWMQGKPIPRKQVFSRPEHMLIGVAGPAPLSLEVFHEASGYRNDVFDRTRSIEGPQRHLLSPGMVACLRAGRDCPLFAEPEETTFGFVMLSRPLQRVQWAYAVDTRRAVRALAADPTASRLEFAAQTLAALGDTRAVANLKSLCEHPDHFVRWSALRCLMRLDSRTGLEILRRAQDDLHPHVRNAATRALQKIAPDDVLRTGDAATITAS